MAYMTTWMIPAILSVVIFISSSPILLEGMEVKNHCQKETICEQPFISSSPILLEGMETKNHCQKETICEQPLFSRDKHTSYLNLPVVMQFESDVFRPFESYWEISNNETYLIGCLKIKGDVKKTQIYTQSSLYGCSRKKEVNTLILPAFVSVSSWDWSISYSLFIKTTVTEENVIEENGKRRKGKTALIIQLNQRKNKFIQHLQYSSGSIKIRRLNMTLGGPKVRFGGVKNFLGNNCNCCCTAITECKNFEGNGISLGFESFDSVMLIPIPIEERKEKEKRNNVSRNNTYTTIIIRVALSKCFSYQIGQYYHEMNDFPPILRVRYFRDQRYHTIFATINNISVIINTIEHYGLNCSNDWFQLHVKNVYVIPNCNASRFFLHDAPLVEEARQRQSSTKSLVTAAILQAIPTTILLHSSPFPPFLQLSSTSAVTNLRSITTTTTTLQSTTSSVPVSVLVPIPGSVSSLSKSTTTSATTLASVPVGSSSSQLITSYSKSPAPTPVLTLSQPTTTGTARSQSTLSTGKPARKPLFFSIAKVTDEVLQQQQQRVLSSSCPKDISHYINILLFIFLYWTSCSVNIFV